MSEVLESRGPFVQGLIVGDPKTLRQFIQAHGHWQQAIELLELGGPTMQQIAQNLVKERDKLVADDESLSAWLTDYPATDAQQLRALIRQARKDYKPEKPGEAPRHGKSYREIFQLVKAEMHNATTPTE